jgi:putative peptidoglycan lipid II flippase
LTVSNQTDLAGATVTVASWTMVSRVTGLIRIVAIGAVLGPTYLGNVFQAINQWPNLTYQALTGSLLSMMLVPMLVPHIDAGDNRETARVAGEFMGMAIAGFALLSAVALAVGPLLLRLLTFGVSNPAIAAAQRRAGWILLITVTPQVVLYGVAGTGEAVMNAHGKFALAAAAPALENVGMIAVMVLNAAIFGTGTSVARVGSSQLLLLGLGSTGAVLAHASAQWWGARSVGVTLIPRIGWRDPEMRALARRMSPAAGYTCLNALRLFGMLVVANLVPGGVIAFQLGLNFIALPVALGAWPVSVALLPQLTRLHIAGAAQRFRDELVQGAGITFFLMIPAAAAYVALARPLARAVSFGAMGSRAGIALVAAALGGLGLAMLGEAGSVVGTHAAYARRDVRSPFYSMVVRTAVSAVFMVGAIAFAHGSAVILVLGLGVSAGNAAGALYLARVLRSDLPRTGLPLVPTLARAGGASAVMIVPAYVISTYLPRAVPVPAAHATALLLAAVVGAGVFLGLQIAWRSPELKDLQHGFGQLLARPGVHAG